MITEEEIFKTVTTLKEYQERFHKLDRSLNSALTDNRLMGALLLQADDFLATICTEPGIGMEALKLRKHICRMMTEEIGPVKKEG